MQRLRRWFSMRDKRVQPMDEGRDPNSTWDPHLTGAQYGRQDFRQRLGQIDYWRDKPLRELDIEIKKLGYEDSPESYRMAQRLRRIKEELHDEQRAHPAINVHSFEARRPRSRPESLYPIRSDRPVLPPADVMGRVTGGNFPRRPQVSDMHWGYSQMSDKTKDLLSQRHRHHTREAQQQFRQNRRERSQSLDRDMQQLRRYDTGLTRQPYSERMQMGEGLDVNRWREETPQILAQNFRDLRFSADRGREIDSKNTQLASLEVWRQRQLDKKYRPPGAEQQPLRRHSFGAQETPKYARDWKSEAMMTMPFNPDMDYFAAPTPGGSVRRPPQRQRRPPFDPERPSTSQSLTNRYLSESGAYQPLPRRQRIAWRRQSWPLRGDEQRLEMTNLMKEDATGWERKYPHVQNIRERLRPPKERKSVYDFEGFEGY